MTICDHYSRRPLRWPSCSTLLEILKISWFLCCTYVHIKRGMIFNIIQLMMILPKKSLQIKKKLWMVPYPVIWSCLYANVYGVSKFPKQPENPYLKCCLKKLTRWFLEREKSFFTFGAMVLQYPVNTTYNKTLSLYPL